MMKKVLVLLMFLVVCFSFVSMSVNAYESPTAPIIETNIKSRYKSTAEYGNIIANISIKDKEMVLKANVADGYKFKEWNIPDSFKISNNCSLSDKEIVLSFENISENDIQKISAIFTNSNNEQFSLFFSKTVVSDQSPETYDNSLYLLLVSIISFCGMIFLVPVIYQYHKK